jgi:hypothetical protein
LYHYLAKEALRPREERHSATGQAAALIEPALAYRRRNGGWMIWDEEVAWSGSAGEVLARLRTALVEDGELPWDRTEMGTVIERIGAALAQGEAVFEDALWPKRSGLVKEALGIVRQTLAPEWSAMARRHGELLGVAWPEKIDAFLVTDCYDWHGGYSHPVTVDVPHHGGIALCEAILHEATHVADVHTSVAGREYLGDRLMERLQASGVERQDAWNAWHAVIFAASGRQVRESVAPDYTDYAEPRGLYSYFKVPYIAPLWDEFASGAIDEDAFTAAVSDMLVNPDDRCSSGQKGRPQL